MKLIIMGCMAQTSRDTLKNLGADKIFDVYNEINILDYMKDEEAFIKNLTTIIFLINLMSIKINRIKRFYRYRMAAIIGVHIV